MTPSFVPKEERKRKLEKKAALKAVGEKKKIHAAKKIAEKIAKDYRKHREERWPWDQHDSTKREIDANKLARDIYLGMKRAEYEKAAEIEKRPKKKQGGLKIGRPSAIEGISEAIGNKLKKKMQRSRETSEKPATKSIELNRSKESGLKEKNASEPRQDRKRRPRTKETGPREQSAEGSRKKKEPKTSEIKATKTAARFSRGDVTDSSGERVKEKERAKGISDTDDGKSHRKSKSNPTPKETPDNPTSEPRIRKKCEGQERLGPKVNTRTPEVRGEMIDSKQKLHELLNEEYSTLKKKKDFPRRLKEAEAHQNLLRKYQREERLEHGDINRIAQQLKANPQTVSNWLTKGMTPRLYTYMEWATPKSEASERVRRILDSNDGVKNAQDVQKRLDNYYLGHEERQSGFHKREVKKMEKYYEFLDRYKKGGNHLDIVKELGLSESGAHAYLEGAKPRLVSLAGQIPSETPPSGYKWLPKKYEHGGHLGKLSDWIEVPEKVTDYKQVTEVLGKLEPLDNEDMRRWEKKFGEFSRGENFMYLLGVTVSDSNVPSSSTGAISMGMNLSKAYDWSQDFGDATCYYLGQLGIRAGRVKDAPAAVAQIETKSGIKEIRSEEQYKWMSENSSFLRWVRRSCLGYDNSPKTYQETDAEWILKSPPNLRLAFLQGLSDGDGGVSKTSYYFCISTHSDHAFVEGLLGSFGVETYRSRTFVRTADLNAVRKAAELPPFKYAEGRLTALDKTVKMINSRRSGTKTNPPSETEVEVMIGLREKGLSYGKIGERLYDSFGYTLDPRNIWKLLQNREPKKKKRTERKKTSLSVD